MVFDKNNGLKAALWSKEETSDVQCLMQVAGRLCWRIKSLVTCHISTVQQEVQDTYFLSQLFELVMILCYNNGF